MAEVLFLQQLQLELNAKGKLAQLFIDFMALYAVECLCLLLLSMS